MVQLSDSLYCRRLSFGFIAGFWDTQVLHIPSVVFHLFIFILRVAGFFFFSERGDGGTPPITAFTM